MKNPLYFITVCCAGRRRILHSPLAASLLTEAWRNSVAVNGWVIGRYVIMPDHAHFFTRALPEAKPLNAFMRDWKRWTANQIIKSTHLAPPIWQPEFFDHVLRSADSYAEKWDYVRANPVRAGLVTSPEAWPGSGECVSLSF